LAFRRENWRGGGGGRGGEGPRHSTDVPTCFLMKAFFGLY